MYRIAVCEDAPVTYLGTFYLGEIATGADDEFVGAAMSFIASDSYSTGNDKLFSIQLAPTSDPTKFLGFIEVNVGNMNDKEQVTGVYAQKETSSKGDLDYLPGLNELLVALSGTENFAVAAWTRQMGTINKDEGAVLTDQDQIIMMNSSEVYAGVYTGSKVADAYDVSITPTFRFTKNAESINDLSILWVERSKGTVKELTDGEDGGSVDENPDISNLSVEKDVLKGIKFYTYGEKNEMITFTGSVNVAEMGDGTLIDHFDASVSPFTDVPLPTPRHPIPKTAKTRTSQS